MQTGYNLMILPYRRAIETAFERDRRARLDAVADEGVQGMLNSLRPFAYWTSGELCIPNHRAQELRLDNRGLLLIPAYFCIGAPVTMFDPTLPPVLIYPVNPQPHQLPGSGPTPSTALAALIGATRAAVLDTIAIRRTTTTTELANQLAISMASTSDHTKVLRESGLITSRRNRNRLIHQLTPLGHALLADSALSLHAREAATLPPPFQRSP
jgi:DNA-binding transcriptional ArsR family regulator